MKTTKKTFDCVEMKRRGAERIYKQVVNMTLEEQLAFWQKRTTLLQKRQQALRMRRQESVDCQSTEMSSSS